MTQVPNDSGQQIDTTRQIAAVVEPYAFDAWPAAEVYRLDGWTLRVTSGVTRRANSVWTVGAPGHMPLVERIEHVETFYRERGLPSTFQLSPLSTPAQLDEVLASRGYTQDAPVSVQTRALTPAGADRRRTDIDVRVRPERDASWWHVVVERGRFAEHPDVLAALLDRIVAERLHATAFREGVPVAAGLGVLAGSWLGVFSMRTLPEHRRAGAATALLERLCAVAHERGASNAYLQVERDNTAAIALYARHGFTEAYGYHYRKSPGRPVSDGPIAARVP
jgi:GNAT superfamily N-acetyltransferase